MLDVNVCARARMSRDARFDGLFVIGVVTTGIYCRPVCPVRPPAEENVRYFRTAAAAQDAGYRPCMRCRPERAAFLPAWPLGSQTVIRAMSLINTGMLNDVPVAALAERLGIGVRQLNRLFHAELGASPKSIARMQRAALARQLIDDTALPFGEVAMVAGYGSLRRFNDDIRSVFTRSPRELRNGKRASVQPLGRVVLTLPVRQPYRADWVLSFLARRAIPGVEEVENETYRRRLSLRGTDDPWLEATLREGALIVSLPAAAAQQAARLLARVRRIFDLDADPVPVDRHLASSPRLAPLVESAAGIRVPGAWDGFELAVRAILGQQVSVDRATRLASSLVQTFGEAGLFPGPEVLARENPAAIGIPGTRGRAIQELARRVAAGTLELDASTDPDEIRRAMCAVPGVGPWTAEYVALRAGRDPDAFPDSDWVVLKMLETTPAGARKLAQAWRPWRGYALMYLWLGAIRAHERSR